MVTSSCTLIISAESCHIAIWSSNRETEKALETLAIQYGRFEQVNSDLADIDKKFDTEFEKMEEAMEQAKEAQQFAEIAMHEASDTRDLSSVGDVV